MFDFLRNLTKSAEERQQEALNAYLDDALSPQERQRFEQRLARDADLRLAVEQRRALQAQLRQLPRRRVPRNFTLDPAVYGRPQRQPLFQLYPVMQAAAVLTALFLILAIGADIFLYGSGSAATSGAAQDVALVAEEAMEEPAAEMPVEVTRVVTETTVEETIEEEEPAAEAAAPLVDAPAAEEMMIEATEFAVEEGLPAAASPPPSTDTMTVAADAAEADEQAGEEPAAIAPLPTPSPQATQTASAFIDATKSTVPRPEAETVTGERAMTAVPTAQPQVVTEAVVIEPTAVPTSPLTREPISGLRLLQIGLGLLLVVLGTAVFYVRRQS